MPSLIERSSFLEVENTVHLAVGGEAPMLVSHAGALARFLADKSRGMPGRGRLFHTLGLAREAAARLFGGDAGEISFLAHASEGLGVAAAGVDWREGDNVVVEKVEFPSGLHVWRRLPVSGVEVRTVDDSEVPSIDDVRRRVDRRTRAIAISHVSYLTGARHDLAAYRELADSVGARLVVDATHAAGVVPVAGELCDVAVSSCYKFLLAAHGIGVFYVNRKRWPELAPPSVGWHAIEENDDWRVRDDFRFLPGGRQFERGNVSFASVYCLENALNVLESIGIRRIEQHVLALGGVLRQGVAELGWRLLTPAAPAARAGNIAFEVADSMRMERELRARSVLVWGGDRRIRMSLHAYTNEDDVDRALRALRDIGRF